MVGCIIYSTFKQPTVAAKPNLFVDDFTQTPLWGYELST